MSTMSERYQALADLLKERDKLKKENKQLKEYNDLLEQRLVDAGLTAQSLQSRLEQCATVVERLSSREEPRHTLDR